MNEEWKPIEGWPYEVSNSGRIRRATAYRNTKVGRVLKTTGVGPKAQDGSRYQRVTLSNHNATRMFRIHQLVLRAFVGPQPVGFVPDHINRRRDDNRLENLRYRPHLENCRDAIRRVGESHGMSKLTDQAVTEIRSMRHLRTSQTANELERRFGVSANRIRKVMAGAGWPHITPTKPAAEGEG